jgi:hypothetical protein
MTKSGLDGLSERGGEPRPRRQVSFNGHPPELVNINQQAHELVTAKPSNLMPNDVSRSGIKPCTAV